VADRTVAVILGEEGLDEGVSRAVRRVLDERDGEPAEEPAAAYVDARELGRRLGLHERTVRRLCREGLPHTRLGKSIRFETAAVQRWLAEGGAR